MKMETNRGVVLHGKMDMRIEEVTVPKIKGNEVLLEMSCVGICGSDIKYWTHGYCGVFTLTDPMIIGHEASGKVVSLGPDVQNLKIGDRVAIEPGVSCRMCDLCKNGTYNLCRQMKFCATPPIDGNLSTYYAHPEDFCFKLPDDVSDEEGALMEPLAVAIHACRKARLSVGSKVLICGAGPVGVLCMWVAKSFGASVVVITDIDDGRLKFAKDQGADEVINVKTLDTQEVVKMVTNVLNRGPDSTIECSGSDSSMNLGIHVTYPGGTIIQVGRGSPRPETPLNIAATKELDIRGVFRYANCYQPALELITSKRLPRIKELVTHRFSLNEAEEAFKTALSKESGAIKVMIQCNTKHNQ